MGLFRDLSVLFSVLLLNFSVIGQSETSPLLPLRGICAHRGAMQTHPENTVIAFKEAIRLGAQMIEFDVRLTKDSELIIMHDETVDRTTNGLGFVSELTLSEIRELDAGSWKSKEFAEEKVPTLKEALQVMPQNIWLNIHLKGNKKLGIETAKLVLSEKRGHQAVIACEKQSAKGVRKVDPEIKICNMQRLSSRKKYIDKTIAKGYPFIQLRKRRDDGFLKRDIEVLKQNKVIINYVQADQSEEIGELLDLGIDFIFTDNLATMVLAFDSYKTSKKMNVETKIVK